jgi:hypothetical protein
MYWHVGAVSQTTKTDAPILAGGTLVLSTGFMDCNPSSHSCTAGLDFWYSRCSWKRRMYSARKAAASASSSAAPTRHARSQDIT